MNEWLLGRVRLRDRAGARPGSGRADADHRHVASADPEKHVDSGGERRWEVTSASGQHLRFSAERRPPRGRAFSALGRTSTRTSSGTSRTTRASGRPAGAPQACLPLLFEAAKGADPARPCFSAVRSAGLLLPCVQPLGGGDFDAVAVQPYTYGAPNNRLEQHVHAYGPHLRQRVPGDPGGIRATMVAFGDADKDVWLTEFGYSTTSQDGSISQRPGHVPARPTATSRRFPVGEDALLVRGPRRPLTRTRTLRAGSAPPRTGLGG